MEPLSRVLTSKGRDGVVCPFDGLSGALEGPVEERRPSRDANVAQSVEQLTRNEQVVGSIPTVGSILKR